MSRGKSLSRRRFIGGLAAAASVSVIPRHVLGGAGFTAPSEEVTKAVIGVGGMGMGHLRVSTPRPACSRFATSTASTSSAR